VAPIADGDAYMPLLDYIAEQIETLEHIGDATHQAHRALMDAVHCREGYDTWPKPDLAEHIRRITALRDALNALRAAVVELSDAERAAFRDYANVRDEPRP
jgi:Mg2+ and Co2+ transporter CorA